MRKLIGLIVLGLSSLEVSAQDNSFYLESIQFNEEEKTAYFASDTGKLLVQEGQTVAHWKVLQIEKDTVLVESEQGKLLELPLHGHLKMAQESSEEVKIVKEQEDQSAEENSPEAESATQEVIPEGYRKINTPFGEFIVPDQTTGSSAKGEPESSETGSEPKPVAESSETEGEPKSVAESSETEGEPKSVEEVSSVEVVETEVPKSVPVPGENVDKQEENTGNAPQKIRTPFGEFVIESGIVKKGEENPIPVGETKPSVETKEVKETVPEK